MLSMSKSLFRRLLKLFAITSSSTGGKYVTQAQHSGLYNTQQFHCFLYRLVYYSARCLYLLEFV